MKTHIFFDLDTTLAPSRDLMYAEHQPIFEKLCRSKDVIVVTGGAQEQIQKQIPFPAKDLYYMLSQQGNYAVDKSGELLWHTTITPEQAQGVEAFARKLTDEFVASEGLTIPDMSDIFENRGSQLASSIYGFHAPNEIKYTLDKDQSKRRGLLASHPDEIEALRKIGIEAMPAGTTTIDFILAGKNKGFNIAKLISHKGWSVDECVYVGDALFKGGNDESVIGVVDTRPVKDPHDTFEFIERELLV
mgnify:CR=1 FL=1